MDQENYYGSSRKMFYKCAVTCLNQIRPNVHKIKCYVRVLLNKCILN